MLFRRSRPARVLAGVASCVAPLALATCRPQPATPSPPAGVAYVAQPVEVSLVPPFAVPSAAPVAPSAPPRPPHVVLVSIDGLRADYYLEADRYGLQIPNLRALMARGRYAAGVSGTFPTVTYPAHTTLVTGVRPSRHGILANRPLDPLYVNQGGWNWYAESIHADTLWDAAHRAGKKSGAVYWPVSVGATIDANFPQYWRAKDDEDDKLLRSLMSPGLASDFTREYPDLPAEQRTDKERGDAAEFLLRRRSHDLTLVYFTDLDEAQHAHGPGTREVKATLERIDAQVGRLVRAVDAAGDTDRTTFVVVSDHGFLPVQSVLRPAALLRQAGLIDVKNGQVTGWRAAVLAAGGLAAIYLKDPSDAAVRSQVVALFTAAAADPSHGIRRLFDRPALDAAGGFAGATLAMEAQPGTEFSPGWSGSLTGPSGERGAHGYSPEVPEMRASLIAAGRGIKPGAPLPVVSMLSIAPTVAQLLGITLEDAEAPALAELLE